MMKRIYLYLLRHIVLFLVNKVFVGTNPKYFPIKRILLNRIGYSIGKGTKIVGPITCTGTLVVGENCWLGTRFTLHGNGKVIAGNNIDFGPEVTFLTGTHAIGGGKRRAGDGKHCVIEICDGCWIGGKSIFLNSIQVGNSSVIAAGAVVCKDISANTLAGGVPARIIKSLPDK